MVQGVHIDVKDDVIRLEGTSTVRLIHFHMDCVRPHQMHLFSCKESKPRSVCSSIDGTVAQGETTYK